MLMSRVVTGFTLAALLSVSAVADEAGFAAARSCGVPEDVVASSEARADIYAGIRDLTAVHVRGAEDSPIELVELFDYVCPTCKALHAVIPPFIETTNPDVRLTVVEFPIWHRGLVGFVMRNQSDVAAAYAIAGYNQDVGLALHDAYLGARGKLSLRRMEHLAVEAGADLEQLQADAETPEVAAAIDANLAWADAMGFAGTPVILLNGVQLPRWSAPVVQCMIDEIRAKAATN